jgi:CRISPR-associated endonuclease Cas2
VQKSAFEGIIKENKYDKLVKELAVYGSNEDSVRIYKIRGSSAHLENRCIWISAARFTERKMHRWLSEGGMDLAQRIRHRRRLPQSLTT